PGFRVGGPPCQSLRELLELSRREGIDAALVLMPEGTEFRSWYPSGAWASVQSFLTDLSREYAAPIINAREWVPDTDFLDSHHLLPRGANTFTTRLGREGLAPLLDRHRGR